MAKTEKHKCCKRVYSGTRIDFGGHHCTKNATIERDGSWYCGIHDPVKVKERQEKADAEYRRKRAINNEKYRRLNAERHYCSKLTTEYLETHEAEMPDAKD